MPGVSALSVLSACTGGHAEIEIRGGWREPLNTYTATIAVPGERKSAVQRHMVRPLFDVEMRLAAAGEVKRFEAQALRDTAMKAAERQREQIRVNMQTLFDDLVLTTPAPLAA